MAVSHSKLRSLLEALDPYQGLDGGVYIRFTSDANGTPQVLDLPVNDERAFRMIRAQLFHGCEDGIPSTAEVANFIETLEGTAYSQPRREVHLDPEFLISSLFVRVIIEIVNRGGMTDTPRALLGYVKKIGDELEVSANEFPSTEDQMGRRLTQLIVPLRQYGIALIRHDSRPRKWTIEAVAGTRVCVTPDTCTPLQVTQELPSASNTSGDSDTSEAFSELLVEASGDAVTDRELAQIIEEAKQ